MVIDGPALLLLRIAQGYGAAGVLVALAFMALGIARVDAGARGAYAFRPLLFPGLTLLWPLVLWRWWRLTRPRTSLPLGRRFARTHRATWTVLVVLLPLLLLAALALRQGSAPETAPVRLAEPSP